MTILLGAIADDFTGATDLAGLLSRSGYGVSLRLGLPDKDTDDDAVSPFEVIALKCRTVPPQQAIDQVLSACAWLHTRGAQRFYWKYCSTFDSTDKGNIGPVSEALLRATGEKQTIYCPAFPENARSVYMGHLFVGEQLLQDSAMKDHPLTPMRDSSLIRLLQQQVTGKVGLVPHSRIAMGVAAMQSELHSLATLGVEHVIVDAISQQDLETIAKATQQLRLLTGGSALAGFLPQLSGFTGELNAANCHWAPPVVGSGQIVLSGSCSAMTLRQIAYYETQAATYQLDPLHLASAGIQDAEAWLRDRAPDEPKLIYAGTDPSTVKRAQEILGADEASALVEQALASLAALAFSMGVRRFVIAGGETSGSVVRALGPVRLQVGREIAPGVPWTYSMIDGHAVALALKSGNFGKVSFFEDALGMVGCS